jgi:CBS domain-containing protein
MKARDIMTSVVITVNPSTKVAEIAKLLLDRHISAVPVTDESRRVLGVVSEGDLVRRQEIGTTKRHSWWLNLLADPATRAAEYTKTHAMTARDVMSQPVISVGGDASLGEIADKLERNRIKRVVVLDGGRLVGIISRANILQALATVKRFEVHLSAGDQQIRHRIQEALTKEPWASVGNINVTVDDGVVTFWGFAGSDEERQASRVLAENVPGVKRVDDRRILRSQVISAS